MSSSRVPRASIAVTILSDPDALEIIHGPDGPLVMWAWIGLVIIAKDENNGGRFPGSLAKYAPRLGMAADALEGAVQRIQAACKANGRKPWILQEQGGWRIRSFAKWNNEWGGQRRGSGRPFGGGRKSSGNQDAQLDSNLKNQVGHLDAASAPASASDPASAPVPAIGNTHKSSPIPPVVVAPTGRDGRREGKDSSETVMDGTGQDQDRIRVFARLHAPPPVGYGLAESSARHLANNGATMAMVEREAAEVGSGARDPAAVLATNLAAKIGTKLPKGWKRKLEEQIGPERASEIAALDLLRRRRNGSAR